MTDNKILLIAAGEVHVHRDKPETVFDLVQDTLRQADIRYAHHEGVYTDGGFPFMEVQFQRTTALAAPARNINALKAGGFDVMSCAGNHILDRGPDEMLKNLAWMRQNGITPFGAGRNLEEARKPAIVERKGTRFAFLSYTSILPQGFNATPETAGCAPIRVWTFLDHVQYEQPGVGYRVLTMPYPEDIEAMEQDIANARALADVVIPCFHWGIHLVPGTISMYEKDVARKAINAGADLVLGNHQHVLKGIDVYKGKFIFHGLSELALCPNLPPKEQYKRRGLETLNNVMKQWEWDPYADPSWALYALPPFSRKAILPKIEFHGKNISRISFLPMMINKQAQPYIVDRKDPDFDGVVDYMRQATVEHGLKAKLRIEGNEVVVEA